MAIETVTYISDLNPANPVGGTDLVSTLDDHIRNMKTGVKNTFPNVSGAITASHTELNYVTGVTSSIQTQFNTLSSSKASLASPTFTGNPQAPTPSTSDSSTSISTTAMVHAAITAAAMSSSTPVVPANAGMYWTNNGTTASWGAIAISKGYQSAEQTITSAGSLTLAHGLGAQPKAVEGFLKCVTAELGYSVGDVLCASLAGASVVPDATNLNVRFSSSVGFQIINKSTGASAYITNGNWTFSLRAYA